MLFRLVSPLACTVLTCDSCPLVPPAKTTALLPSVSLALTQARAWEKNHVSYLEIESLLPKGNFSSLGGKQIGKSPPPHVRLVAPG